MVRVKRASKLRYPGVPYMKIAMARLSTDFIVPYMYAPTYLPVSGLVRLEV